MTRLNKVGVNLDEMLDSTGRYKTQSLFLEYKTISGEPPVYTLRPGTRHGCPSLKDLFIEMEDPTEYLFAIEAFGSWEQWQKMAGPNGPDWFRPYVEAWREELETKLRAKGVAEMLKLANTKSEAAKWLADAGWKERKRGRPSKEELEAEKKRVARVKSSLDEDAERLGLTRP